tara:strand:+ start:971 stop:1210 length:240 start_codon:yes stop_codon:yes gene_type:complete
MLINSKPLKGREARAIQLRTYFRNGSIVARLSKPLAGLVFQRRGENDSVQLDQRMHRNGSSLESWPAMLSRPLACLTVY